MNHAKCYRAGYPRPRFVRESFFSLDGVWNFAFDDEERGEREAWEKGGKFDGTINVPYAYQAAASGIGTDEYHPVLWYSRTFSAEVPQGKRLLLHFEGVDYLAKVWLNGRCLGAHRGGYARFSLDATDFLKAGDNLLVVRCEDRRSLLQPRGKQRYVEKNVSCFYTDTSGIWKSVWAEVVGASYLASVSALCDYGHCALRLEYEIAHWRQGLRFGVELSFGGELVSYTETQPSAPYGRICIDLTLPRRVLPMKPWYAGGTQFFDVRYFLKEGDEVLDEVGSYTGLVCYGTRENAIEINYLPNRYFRMVLAQGYYPAGGMTATEEELLRDCMLIKELGFNGVRMHQKIEDERFYYFCDMLGLFFWLEMPAVYDFTAESASALTEEWTEIVRQYRGYLALMAYVPVNESWGVLQTAENGQMQAFTSSLYSLTKALDPTRFVISNDGWEHTKSDIVTLHNYAQTGEELRLAYGDMARALRGGFSGETHSRAPFARGWEYGGQPVIVSEYGGVAYEKGTPEGWGYGTAARDGEELLSRLKELTQAIVDTEAQGYCLTQFTDVMQEKNGLLTEAREPKMPIERLREINQTVRHKP